MLVPDAHRPFEERLEHDNGLQGRQKLDERFRYVDGDFVCERLHRASRTSEGPAYFPAGRYLLWSDIPNDRLLRFDETAGTFGQPSGHANGNIVDRQGRLVTCEPSAAPPTRRRAEPPAGVRPPAARGDTLVAG